MTSSPDLTPLVDVPRRLHDEYTGIIPTYRQIWKECVDGKLESVKSNGRYYVALSAIPAIAARFGLRRAESVAA